MLAASFAPGFADVAALAGFAAFGSRFSILVPPPVLLELDSPSAADVFSILVPPPVLPLELALPLAVPVAAPFAAPFAALPDAVPLDAVLLPFVDVVVSVVPFFPDAAVF